MATVFAVAIVGAGPYGLSLAAHLAARGVDAKVIGPPMAAWRDGMPRGMRLKSEGFASRLFDPGDACTLAAFCAEHGLPYADLDVPVPVETFTAYGEAFQKRFVPDVDPRQVARVERAPHGFTLTLDDGEAIAARRVVVATGVAPFKHVPDALAGLSRAGLTHTCEHADYSAFAGKRVVVVGAGASAVDAAAALQRGGADTHLLSRRAAVRFHAGGNPRGWRQRLRSPMTPLGPGWKKLVCVKAPLVFHALPAWLRNAIVGRYLGPAPGFAAREDFVGKVALHLSSTLLGARETVAGVTLEIAGADGTRRTLAADHVVAGTGYRVDVDRLAFLAPDLAAGIARNGTAPKLTARFETSVPGLYMVGPAAAFEFGPMLRFVCGAGFASRRVAAHVAAAERTTRRSAEPHDPAPRLLFVGLVDDVASDRIVAAMAGHGARCAVMCAAGAFAARTRHAERIFALPRRGGAWMRSLFLGRRLAAAARAWRPDLVIPLDELSARSLRDSDLHRRAPPALRALLAASLGDPASFATLRNRHRLVETAAALGVATPTQIAVADLAAARAAARTLGYPAVLKREQTCGGAGVAIVADEAALDAAFAKADAKAHAKRRLQRLLGREVEAQSPLVLQRHVAGRLAFRVLACKDGRVLDGVSFLSESVHPPVTGASTVVAAIERADMDSASAALVAALRCSGFVSLDFILPEDGPAVFIEMNPRPVASGHLGRLFGHDIHAALLDGPAAAPRAAPAAEAPTRVALFPRELDRDPRGAAFAPGVLHDVPWDDPAAVAAHAEWLARRHPADAERLGRLLGRDATPAGRRPVHGSAVLDALARLLPPRGPASAK